MRSETLICTTGNDIRALRKKLDLNQVEFWKRLHVTQSGGSRYEAGRTIPKQVLMLIHLVFADEKAAATLLKKLREDKVGELPETTVRQRSARTRTAQATA